MKKILLGVVFIINIINIAQAQIIDKINITGLNTIERGTVLNYLPFEAGDFYSTNSKKRIHDALVNTGFFKNIAIIDYDNILAINVEENPIIKDIIIEMESEDLVEKSKIVENLNAASINKGEIYNQKNFQDFLNQLNKVYATGGYSNAEITHKVDIDTNNLATIKLSIDEKEVLKINKIFITGNTKFTDDALLNLFDIGEADNFVFNFFTKRDHFSQISLDAGVDKLINYYLNNGYLDIKILDIKKEQNKDKINVTVHISEGELYYVGNVDFVNLSELDDAIIPTLFSIKQGSVFKRSEVIESIQHITDTLADKGYAFAKVDSETQKRIDANIVDLEIYINGNQKVYINRITIDGNTRTADEVIRREIGVLEGGLYNNTKINQSILKLKRLSFFSDVSMKVSAVRGSNDKINLHFHITETKTGQFSVGISHSNATGVAFNTGIKEKNIFGSGNELNAALAYSKAVQNIDVFFLNPYFTVDGHSISYGIFNKEVDGSELESSSYLTNKTGISIGYGIPLDEDSRLSANLKVSNTDITCGGVFSSTGYESNQCADDYSSEVYTSIGYVSNTLNNAIFPTKGDKLNIDYGIAIPLADYRYHKLDVDYKKYMPLSEKLTLKFNTRLGVANGYSGRELPFFERYYGGGASSVRGFRFNSLGDKYPDGKSKGGKSSMLGSVSIISPLSWVENSENMRVSAFIDAGGISSTESITGVNYRISAGVGFVWMTPIGPLGVYAATPLKKEAGDDIKNFDFTLGTTF